MSRKIFPGAVSVLRDRPLQGVEPVVRSEEHTSELQSRLHLVCRLLLEKKKNRRLRKTSSSFRSAARQSLPPPSNPTRYTAGGELCPRSPTPTGAPTRTSVTSHTPGPTH